MIFLKILINFQKFIQLKPNKNLKIKLKIFPRI